MTSVVASEIPPEELPPPDDPDANPEPEPTDEAPYGYKADGTPKKRPGRKPGEGASGGTTPRSSKSLASLREPLIQRLVEYGGAPLALASPLAFAYWEERAEHTADSLLVIAARSPRTRKWIERFVTGTSTGDLGITFAGVLTAMMVDNGKVDPQSRFPHWLGLDSLYLELYGSFEAEAQNPSNARGLFAEVG